MPTGSACQVRTRISFEGRSGQDLPGKSSLVGAFQMGFRHQ